MSASTTTKAVSLHEAPHGGAPRLHINALFLPEGHARATSRA